MADLFGKTRQNINLHINNCFKERELSRKSTVKKSLTVPREGIRQVQRRLEFFNLDVIISVGYRVKSMRGTQFRQWATRKLKDYLIEGVALNESRLEQKSKKIEVLRDGIRILNRPIKLKNTNENDFNCLYQFSFGLKLLEDYDNESFDIIGCHKKKTKYPSLEDYFQLVERMRNDFSSKLFGKKKDFGFESSIYQIGQSSAKRDVYPSVEEKAAMLLYLIVKNHSFVDGNKRIAAACFLLFLKTNGLLHDKHEQPIISNEALTGLTLFVAASKPEEAGTVKQLLVSVLVRGHSTK